MRLFESKDDRLIELVYHAQQFRAVQSDYFESLCRIREQLEPLEIYLRCYGASRNCFPSGMARDMGRGLKVYRLTMEKKAKLEDLVELLADGSDVEVSTVAEQQHYFQTWLRSKG